MAKISDKQWAKAKLLYENGNSLRKIAAETEINHQTINDRAKSLNWEKGISEYTKKGITPAPFVLYIITAKEFDGIYKIGITNDIEFRLSSFQTGCPFKLFACRVFVCENPRGIEFSLHAFFKKKRLEGEWFRLTDVDIAYIDEALSDG
jgi:hypothetical protein